MKGRIWCCRLVISVWRREASSPHSLSLPVAHFFSMRLNDPVKKTERQLSRFSGRMRAVPTHDIKSQSPLLEANNITFSTPSGLPLGDNISFSLMPGQCLLVTGPNGSGKSTFLKLLVGLHKAGSGSINFSVSRDKVAYFPQLQNIHVHFPLTLKDVLQISSKGDLDLQAVLSWGLLDETQLELAWNTSSGGERNRTLLTQLLLQNPSVLILDEPLNHLDKKSRTRMMDAIFKFLETGNGERAVILVSHEGLTPKESSSVSLVNLELRGNNA